MSHFKSLALKNCGIVDPAGAAFDAEKHQIIGKNGNEVTGKIVISNSTTGIDATLLDNEELNNAYAVN